MESRKNEVSQLKAEAIPVENLMIIAPISRYLPLFDDRRRKEEREVSSHQDGGSGNNAKINMFAMNVLRVMYPDHLIHLILQCLIAEIDSMRFNAIISCANLDTEDIATDIIGCKRDEIC
jgi:hypothetical protein